MAAVRDLSGNTNYLDPHIATPGGSGGGGSLSAQANAVAPAASEGASIPLSLDLARNLRTILANGTGFQKYYVNTAGSGYSIGDIVVHILDVDFDTEALRNAYINVNTMSAITPNLDHLTDIDLNLLYGQGFPGDTAWNGTDPDASLIAIMKGFVEDYLLNNDPVLVELGQDEYEVVAASATNSNLGATGAVGDYLASITIQPSTTVPGSVVVKDGSTTIMTWPGSAAYPAHLAPIEIAIGAKSVNGAWNITTGSNVSVMAVGKFT